jgi:FtsH-binding integral membrane protein
MQYALTETSSNQVLSKTFQLLGASMIPTALFAFLTAQIPVSFYQSHPIGMIVAQLILFVISIVLMFSAMKARNENIAVLSMMAFAGVMGASIGPTLAMTMSLKNGGELIAMSAGMTGAVLFALTAYAKTSKKDFSFLGGFLFVGLILLLIASIVGMFIQSTILQLTLASIGVLLFSAYILYDVSRVVTGGETNPVFAAISIYLDVINLFLHLLRLLTLLSGKDD